MIWFGAVCDQMEAALAARDVVGVEDFVLLEDYSNIAAFVDNLRKRFRESLIYVSSSQLAAEKLTRYSTSVCHKLATCRNGWGDGAGFGMQASSACPTLCYERIRSAFAEKAPCISVFVRVRDRVQGRVWIRPGLGSRLVRAYSGTTTTRDQF